MAHRFPLGRTLAVVVLVAAVAAGARVALGETWQPAATPLRACAAAGRPVVLPSALTTFPLPRNTVVDGRKTVYGYTVLTGRVPGSLDDVRSFFAAQIPRHGWALGAGDAEANEAEAFFSGLHGTGHFKVHTLLACSGALSLRLTFKARR